MPEPIEPRPMIAARPRETWPLCFVPVDDWAVIGLSSACIFLAALPSIPWQGIMETMEPRTQSRVITFQEMSAR